MGDDESGWDGPNIRPPQHRPGGSFASSDRDRRSRRPLNYAARRPSNPTAASGRRDRGRDRGDGRDSARHRVKERDLRDRLTNDRRRAQASTGGGGRRNVTVVPATNFSKSGAFQSEKHRERRDLQAREKRRQIEKEMQEIEQQMKRRRERSRSKERHKMKRSKNEAKGEESEDESESEDEETEEEDSEEEGSDTEEGSASEGSGDTASERSGATPDNVSDEEEVEDGEKVGSAHGEVEEENDVDEEEEAEEEVDEVQGRWGRESDRSSKAESKSRTVSRSPTPIREDSDTRASFADGVEEHKGGEEVEDGDEEKIESGVQNQPVEEGEGSVSKEMVKDFRDELPPYLPSVQGCRSVEEFKCLNRIEEGTYGVVYRARDQRTNEIVALKRLKMEREKEGFPITSLREINTLLISQHPNVVTVREIVVGSNMDKIYIVMDFVEHDMKSLMETMRKKHQVFLPGEIKCLMIQLLSAISHLHDNWILHRDLKSSNLLLSHNGILKVGDFGLAREYGSPLQAYTAIVVTLWYRAPELLLGVKEYSTAIDVWSIGCIFGELLLMNPLFPGESEVDELNRIFRLMGTPNERSWTGYGQLPAVQKMKFIDYPISNLRTKFPREMLSEKGLDLLKHFLTYDPKKRIPCDEALDHDYFLEAPKAIDPSMFPTWPAKSELGTSAASKKAASPKPPSGGGAFKKINDDDDDSKVAGFELKFGAMPTAKVWNLKF